MNIIPLGIPTEDMVEEMDRMFSADRTQEQPCIRCGTPFLPKLWFFYGLCDKCFELFDMQKMQARLANMFQVPRLKDATESVREWIERHPFVSQEEDDKYYFALKKRWAKYTTYKKKKVIN
jgi:hypothetical protein